MIEQVSLDELPAGISINELFKDQRGLLWLGTSEGLFQYDGYDWKSPSSETSGTHAPQDNLIFSLCEDDSATLWLATNDGLIALDQRTGHTTRYDPELPATANTQLSYERVRFARGFVWLTTWNDGLLRFDPQQRLFTQYQPSAHPHITHDGTTALLEDRAGILWVGTQQGLCRFDADREALVCYQYDTLQPTAKSNHVNALHEDPDGTLWVGTYQGLLRFDRTTEQFTHYAIAADRRRPNRNFIRSLAPGDAEHLWVGTYDNLVRFRKEDGQVTVLSDMVSRTPERVETLLNDGLGSLWVGTTGGTLDRILLRPKPFGHVADSLSHAAMTVLNDASGKVWYGTARGLYRTDRRTGQSVCVYRAPAPSSGGINKADIVPGLTQDYRGTVWFGTDAGQLYRVDTATLQTERVRDFTIRKGIGIWELYTDRRHSLWIATGGDGLFQYDLDTRMATHYVHQANDSRSLPDNFVGPITEDATGQLWVGTTGGGVQRLDPATGHFQSYQHDPTDTTSLASNHVVSLYSPHAGVLWVGTMHGLSKLDPKTGRFTHYGTDRGLPSERICAIVGDETGTLWISTDRGLSRFDPERALFSNYFATDGLASEQFMFGSASRENNGEILFGTRRGVVTFFPAKIRQTEQESAPLSLRQISITDQRSDTTTIRAGSTFASQDVLRLTSQQHALTFQFALLNYRHSLENHYACWLEGYDSDWQHLGHRREVTYNQLPPGAYTLRVKAANRELTWGLDQLAIPIVVSVPLWAQPWFRLLGVCLMLSLVGGTGYWWLRAAPRASPVSVSPAEAELMLTSDERFLLQATDIVENNLENPMFKVDDFSRETGVSRTLLYRKIRRLTGQSVNDFIRSVRLRRAHQLLHQQNLTIAEVAHRVGFSNPSYFSKCFRKEYGMLPSQYFASIHH